MYACADLSQIQPIWKTCPQATAVSEHPHFIFELMAGPRLAGVLSRPGEVRPELGNQGMLDFSSHDRTILVGTSRLLSDLLLSLS